MRVDRLTILFGLRSSIARERQRREALLVAKAEEARQWLNEEYDRMAARLGLDRGEEDTECDSS